MAYPGSPPKPPGWFNVVSVIFLVLATVAILDWLVGGNEQARGLALFGLFAWGVYGVVVAWRVVEEYAPRVAQYVGEALVYVVLGSLVLGLLALLVYAGPTGWAVLTLVGLGVVLWGLTRVFIMWLAKVVGDDVP